MFLSVLLYMNASPKHGVTKDKNIKKKSNQILVKYGLKVIDR